MADVASNIYDWSTTAGSNLPADATTIGAGLADNFQQIQATVRTAFAHKGADIASNLTTDLGAVPGLFHDITGTATITSFGTVAAGIWKIIKFEGALTLTHNATSLILPGGANITTADGDVAVMFSEGSGNWRCVSYTFAGPLVVPSTIRSSGTTANVFNTVATTVNAFSAATSVSMGANAGNFTIRGVLSGAFKPRVNLTYTPGDTTPSVLDSGVLSISNAGPVTITNFDDGVDGQLIFLFFEDGNTTINRSNAVLAGGVNFVSSGNDFLVLYKTATVWAEVCRSINS